MQIVTEYRDLDKDFLSIEVQYRLDCDGREFVKKDFEKAVSALITQGKIVVTKNTISLPSKEEQ